MSDLKSIKASECRFAGEIEIAPVKEGAKSAPIRVIARTGNPLNHHVLGRIVHDFDSMQRRDRVTLDYNHNPNDVVGYGNKFDHSSGDLEIGGALTPHKDSDRASEIISKMSADAEDGGGVPYEASIYFAAAKQGDKIQVERLGEGTHIINGRSIDGPVNVIRNWRLRGVAITPYGYDPDTSTVSLNDSDRDISVELIHTEATEMSDTPVTTTDEITLSAEAKAVDADQVNDSPEADAVKTESAVEGQPTETALSTPAQKYFDAFGEQRGSWYFAHAIPFDEAMAKDNKSLRERVEQLEGKLDAQSSAGHDEALPASEGDVSEPDQFKDKEGKWSAVPVFFDNDSKKE